MRINGNTISPSIEILVLPRDTGDIIFKARGLVDKDYDDFRKLCPEPEPPWAREVGKEKVQDITDPDYLKEFNAWVEKRFQWMYIKSLDISPGLVWETVEISNSDTWKNIDIELKGSLSIGEYNKVVNLVRIANALDNRKIEEAKKRFMLAEAQPKSQ